MSEAHATDEQLSRLIDGELSVVARDSGIRLLEVRPLDDSLESLFRELVR